MIRISANGESRGGSCRRKLYSVVVGHIYPPAPPPPPPPNDALFADCPSVQVDSVGDGAPKKRLINVLCKFQWIVIPFIIDLIALSPLPIRSVTDSVQCGKNAIELY